MTIIILSELSADCRADVEEELLRVATIDQDDD